ncbi:MAG: acetyl-CoA carboxylase biotin carboxyl carrier protein [bacterium]
MDLKRIKSLVKLVEEASISHLSVELDGMKIDVKKEFSGAPVLTQQAVIPAPVAAVPPVVADTPPSATEKPVDDTSLTPIKAEMVGTFYASANPDSEPYVGVGSQISPGDVLYIVEAMKLFNEVESEWTGVIKKICVKNGESVEFGQTIFLVEEQ